jgi:DNA mismatch endonuclease (patch repair protein)
MIRLLIKMASKGRKTKAGHRKWAARGQKVQGEHRGDIMSPEKRSAVMSRIKGKDTASERTIMEGLVALGLSFETHTRDLPGRPDVVFRKAKFAVFIDGSFWHGWRFPLWEHKMSPSWREKIHKNRLRDKRNHRLLRQSGWKVLRIWEHQVEKAPMACIEKITGILEALRAYEDDV